MKENAYYTQVHISYYVELMGLRSALYGIIWSRKNEEQRTTEYIIELHAFFNVKNYMRSICFICYPYRFT